MTRVIAAVVGTPWLLLAFMGISTLSVPSKAGYYFGIPLAMFGLVVGGVAISRFPNVRFAAYFGHLIALLALPVYLLPYTGGM